MTTPRSTGATPAARPLPSIQVEEGGRCWRCHNEVRLIRRPTWFLRITPYLEENDPNTEALRKLGRPRARHPALHPRSQRWGGGRSRGLRGGPHRLQPAPRGAIAEGPLRPALAPHPDVEAWTEAPASATSWSGCAPAAGIAAPATPARCRSSTPGPRSPGREERSCRSSSRRSSTPAMGRPRPSASPWSTSPTATRRPAWIAWTI